MRARISACASQMWIRDSRQHVVEHGGVTVIEDCYNANPDSMRAALLTLKEYPVRGRRVAVLGDIDVYKRQG